MPSEADIMPSEADIMPSEAGPAAVRG
jgi:hypothetical protein